MFKETFWWLSVNGSSLGHAQMGFTETSDRCSSIWDRLSLTFDGQRRESLKVDPKG
jgi:hypothetical protein